MTWFYCSKDNIRTCTAMCRGRGCHRKCKTYQERTRLPKDMAAWCRLVSLCADREGEERMMGKAGRSLTPPHNSRGAVGPGKEMR